MGSKNGCTCGYSSHIIRIYANKKAVDCTHACALPAYAEKCVGTLISIHISIIPDYISTHSP